MRKVCIKNEIKTYVRGGGSLPIKYILGIIFLAIIVAIVKYPKVEKNYLNSDATWHTLLTMRAYDETPVTVHKFLPIVSLGGERDKGIPWGATIPDKKGNYYYTSFSPMGYILPYFFIKILHLEFSEYCLYIFNTVLLCISCIVMFIMFCELFRDRMKYSALFVVFVIYIVSPEIMHGMGVVYWHQSLMQVFIPLQIFFYYKYIITERKQYWYLTMLMCMINPYTEWSGYVANGGLFIAELIRNRKKRGLSKVTHAFWLAIATIISFALFCGHYLLVTDYSAFFNALKSRFLARNITTDVSLKLLFDGYWESFTAFIVLITVFLMVLIYKRGSVKSIFSSMNTHCRLIFLVSVVPVIENIVMKQHAVSYTYDRMKLALPLMMLLYWLLTEIMVSDTIKLKWLAAISSCIIIAVPFINYLSSDEYWWTIDYQRGNEQLCEYINSNYDDSIVGCNTAVRGYLNMILGRGCYEGISDTSQLEMIAESMGARYIVLLYAENTGAKGAWNMYKLSAEVYDRENDSRLNISNENSNITVGNWNSL